MVGAVPWWMIRATQGHRTGQDNAVSTDCGASALPPLTAAQRGEQAELAGWNESCRRDGQRWAVSAPTIEQIARLARVSRSTVSRVLNNHPNVRPAVRDRIVQVIDEHDYTPRAAARSLARRQTNLIGIIIPE